MWPLPNPWSSAQSLFNNTVAKVQATYNKAVSSTKKSLSNAGNAVTKWTRENKTEPLNTAKTLKTVGNAAVVSGTVAAVTGAPVAGVGAAPGIAIAAGGSALSTIADGIEIFTNLVSGDTQKGVDVVGDVMKDKMLDHTIDAALPGNTPGIATAFSEGISDAKKITQNAVESTKIVTQKDENKKN